MPEQGRFEQVQVGTVGFKGDSHDPGSVPAQKRKGAVIGRLFGKDDISWTCQRVAKQIQKLQGAVGSQHLVRIDIIPVGQPSAQWGESKGAAVLQCFQAISFNCFLETFAHHVQGKYIGGRRPPRKDYGLQIRHDLFPCRPDDRRYWQLHGYVRR